MQIGEMHFPSCLKKAIVVPVFKNGDMGDITNYRPIALLPVFSKILEKILLNQSNEYFESSNLFCNTQFGFIEKSNTVTAISTLVEQIRVAFDEGEYAVCWFLDLSKAFDCISHKTLLMKLYMHNLHPKSCKILTSFLNNRDQVVKINSTMSGTLPLNHGVPQGSVLGPFLFLVSINDFSDYMANSCVQFADDTTLFYSKNLAETLQTYMEMQSRVSVGFNANHLVFNTDKSKKMLCTLKHTTLSDDYSPSVKFFGVYWDPSLSWQEHGEFLAKKLYKNIY